MKHSRLKEIIKEVLDEMSTTGGVEYLTPKAFAKKGQKKNSATKFTEKAFGMKTVERPKRPSNTKMFTFLNEKMAIVTPNAFTSEYDQYNQDGVKYCENIGMEVVDKPKKLSKKTLENYSDSH
jgi:hypothetical protein